MAGLNVSGLKPLDTSGLTETDARSASPLDVSGLKPLDVSGLTAVDEPALRSTQNPAFAEDTASEQPGFLSTVGQALVRGGKEGLQETAAAAQGWHEKPPAEPDNSYVGKLLQQPLGEGYSNPDWWGAQIAHGVAKSSPSLAAGIGGAAAGGAIAGPPGALAGSIAGFGLGSAIQEIAPAYQRARADGLSHEDAVNRAWLQSGVAGAFGAAMGAVPGLGSAGATAKQQVGKALADIFVSMPAIGAAHQVTSAKIEGKDLSLENLAQGYLLNAATGATLVGGHKIVSAATAPTPRSSPEDVASFLGEAARTRPADAPLSPMVDNFQREVLTRSGFTAEQLDAMSPGERTQAYNAAVAKGGFSQPAPSGPTLALPPPEATPPASPVPRAPEPQAAIDPAAAERDGLLRYGYRPEQIDAMTPAQRTAEYQNAGFAGVAPPPTPAVTGAAAAQPGTAYNNIVISPEAPAAPQAAPPVSVPSVAPEAGQTPPAAQAAAPVTAPAPQSVVDNTLNGGQPPLQTGANPQPAPVSISAPSQVVQNIDTPAPPPAPPTSHPHIQALFDDPRTAAEIRRDMAEAKAWQPSDDWQPVPQGAALDPTLETKVEGDRTLARIPPQPGSREAPIDVQTSNDVHAGAERTADPTPAQAEAGNYSKRHLKWNGLDIAVETEAGQDRTGIGADGAPWSHTLEHPYGYIKSTVGKDGDHIDLYLGPDPNSPHVYAFDQVDPDNRKFDEHKIVIGARSQDEARSIYEAGFNDGSGQHRWGAVTEMSVPEFKTWLAKGDTKKPLGYQPPKPASAPKERAPLSLFQFLAKNGGIQDQGGELRSLDLHNKFVPGYGRLLRSSGMPLDRAREAAVEAGYLHDAPALEAAASGGMQMRPSESTIDHLLGALGAEARGERVYSAPDRQAAADRQEKTAVKQQRAHALEVEADVRDMAKSLNITRLTDEEVRATVEQVMVHNANLEDALVDIVERSAMAGEDHLVSFEPLAGVEHGQPPENAATGTHQARAELAPAREQPAGAQVEPAAGSAPPREQSGGAEHAGRGQSLDTSGLRAAEHGAGRAGVVADEAGPGKVLASGIAKADRQVETRPQGLMFGHDDEIIDVARDGRRSLENLDQFIKSVGGRGAIDVADVANSVEMALVVDKRGRLFDATGSAVNEAEGHEALLTAMSGAGGPEDHGLVQITTYAAQPSGDTASLSASAKLPLSAAALKTLRDVAATLGIDPKELVAKASSNGWIQVAEADSGLGWEPLHRVLSAQPRPEGGVSDLRNAAPGLKSDTSGLKPAPTADDLEIPDFLRRSKDEPKATPAPEPVPQNPASNDAEKQGTAEPAVRTPESEIKAEADTRWRNWMPSREHPHRPRLQTYIKIVRKERRVAEKEAARAKAIEEKKAAKEAAKVARKEDRAAQVKHSGQFDELRKSTIPEPASPVVDLRVNNEPTATGLRLRELERKSDGHHLFEMVDGAGNVAGSVRILENQGGKNLYVGDVRAGDGKNAIGPAAVRGLLSQLADQFPNADTMTGLRISGARESTSRVKIPLRKKPEPAPEPTPAATPEPRPEGGGSDSAPPKAAEPEGLVERIPGQDGTEVLIVKNSDGESLNVVMRDTDAQETVGPIQIVKTLERARAKARDMLKGPSGAPQSEPSRPALELSSEGLRPIEDFGEKIEGARKDTFAGFRDSLRDEMNVATEPLSKSFPQPNYEKLAASGVDKRVLAHIAIMRDTIPNRPRVPYKAKQWAAQVEVLRSFARRLLDGEIDVAKFEQGARDNYALKTLPLTAEAIEGVAPADLPRAAQYRVNSGSYSMLNGQRYSPSKTFWFLESPDKRMMRNPLGNDPANPYTYRDNPAEAVALAKQIIENELKAKPATEAGERSKYTDVGVYHDRATKKVFLGLKVRSTVIRLKADFENVKSAREYLAENRDQLQALIDEMRKGPNMRGTENRARSGEALREGDVSPDMFGEAFGFRGVQFGNYVEGPRRQADLNRAFDALMDLADVVGVPPRALSLNGDLGLAFGARGHGGSNAAAAHYEPGRVVINLTKGSGPGSLAHEWLHALDNYFARQDKAGGYMSERHRDSGPVRDEVYKAWKEYEATLQKGSFADRSAEFDKARSKPYFGTTIEKAARAFERYIVDRLSEKGAINDYLANIDTAGGAYPTAAEMTKLGIRPALDKLFDTIETRDTDRGVEMFKLRDGAVTPAFADSAAETYKALRAELDRIGLKDVALKLEDHIGRYIDGELRSADGAYLRSAITVALDGKNTFRTLHHEALHALRDLGLFTDGEWSILSRAADKWREQHNIDERYSAFSDDVKTEEGVAHAYAEWAAGKPATKDGRIARLFRRIRDFFEALGNALRGRGFKTAESIFRKIDEGEIGARPRNADKAGEPAYAVRKGEGDLFKTEAGADNKPQTVIPGAEKISDRALAERKGAEPLRSGKTQKTVGDLPLFGEQAKQGEMFALRHGPVAEKVGALRTAADKAMEIVDEGLLKVAPMAVGSVEAQAAAKDFANAVRQARHQWSRRDDLIKKNFTPEERAKMWGAADHESVALQTGIEAKAGEGMSGLSDPERKVVEGLQDEANRTWAAAQDVGIVEGEGLPSYVPRMMVLMNEAGGFDKPPSGAGPAASPEGIGRGFRTTTGQTKQRKYMTADETEAAMKARFGPNAKIAKDIRALSLGTAKLQEAIAARALVNKIKSMGDLAGARTVSEGHEPQDGQHWFTLDHPAFKTYRPIMQKNEKTGKWEGAKYDDGTPAFERVPIYIRSDFKGPLLAVLGKDNGAIYNGFMALKGKAMSMVMYSPVIHNMVEYSRAMPSYPLKVASTFIYFEGNRAKHDPTQMREAIDAGMVPIGKRFFNQDITSIMEEPSLAPGNSWTSQVLGFIPGLFDRGAGDAVKRAVDKAGDFWHNKLLWDRVADLQMGLYVNMRRDLIAKGHDAQTASRTAAHFANRYAGALPIEAMSSGARKLANLILFSRTFTFGNLGAMKDMLVGLPRDVQAQILRDAGPEALGKIKTFAKRKSMAILILDIALGVITTSLMQDAFKKLRGEKDWPELFADYYKRFIDLIQHTGDHPADTALHPINSLWKLSSTATNEPRKREGMEARVLLYHDRNGRAIYGRNPMGKIGEEFTGWPTAPGDMILRKLGTFARPALQTMLNDKYVGSGFDRPTPIWRPNPEGAEWFKNAARIALHFAEAQLPADALRSGADLLDDESKKDPATSKLKILAPFAGVSISQGHPKGYGAAVREHQRKERSLDKRFGQ